MITTRGSLGAYPGSSACDKPAPAAPPTHHRESLTTAEVQHDAEEAREAALKGAADVSKFQVVTLKAALVRRGINTAGLSKAELVQQICHML